MDPNQGTQGKDPDQPRKPASSIPTEHDAIVREKEQAVGDETRSRHGDPANPDKPTGDRADPNPNK